MITNILFLASLNKVLIDYLSTPVKRHYPELDLWWLLYVALGTGAVIGWLSGIDAFPNMFADGVTGRILTAVLIGGGSSLIHDVFDGNTPTE